MNTATLSIRTDDKTKKEISDFADSLGLSISALAVALLKQAVRDGQVTLARPLEPTPYLEKIMRQAEKDLKQQRNMSKPMDKGQALEHLRSL